MSEAENLKTAEAKLQKLASRLNRGWAVLHPAKEKHLEAVRTVVREQWASQQKTIPKQKVAKTTAPKKKSKSASKDHGHSH